MKKYLGLIFLVIVLWNCSGGVDTATMLPEDHLNHALELYNDEDYEYSIREFQSILLQYPGSTVNDDAQYYLAMSYYNDEQYLLAAYEFSKLIRDIRASEFVSSSQYMLAESYFQLSPPYQLDQAYTTKAITEFQAFIDFFPTDTKVEEAELKIKELNEKLAQKDFMSARIYDKMDYFRASIKYYTDVYETYHDTQYASRALYRKIIKLLERERFAPAFESIKLFLAKYPDDENIEEIQEYYDELSFESP